MLGLLLGLGVQAQAEVGLILAEAVQDVSSRWTGEGHTAVYLSAVCADSPIRVRLCRAGEQGVVLSNYRHLGEDQNYEWNAVPLNLYLYGVENTEARPEYANSLLRWVLEERYRKKYLSSICHDQCATDPKALWRESVANSFLRDLYMFSLRTTREQDRAFVEQFNRKGNVGHYNLMWHNCADFVQEVVNFYYPGAAQADHLNDLGVTGPKAIAKSFTHYGVRHPELGLQVTRFTQIPGEFPPSKDNRKGTEEMFRANRWRVPMAFLLHWELLGAMGSYGLTGRFNPERELQRRPSAEANEEWSALSACDSEACTAAARQRIHALRIAELGSHKQWAQFAAQLHRYEAEAEHAGLDTSHPVTKSTLANSWVEVDAEGGLWARPKQGSSPKVGLSANTLPQPSSDARLAYRIMLERVDAELRRKPKNRATLRFFQADWALLQRLRLRALPASASLAEGEAR